MKTTMKMSAPSTARQTCASRCVSVRAFQSGHRSKVCIQRASHKTLKSSATRTNHHRSCSSRQHTRVVAAAAQEPVQQAVRDDEILPDSLADALSDAAKATSQALLRSTNRARVEIIMPEFWDPVSGPIFPESGDNEKFWKMVKRFIDNLIEQTGAKKVKVLFPDMGAAVMCENWWADSTFGFASVQDRNPVDPTDDLVIFAAPDPYGAEACRRVVRQVVDQDEAAGSEPRPMVMFNPRLASGDAGIGLNYRRLQAEFLNTFLVTYSLQPYGDAASVFRMYPRPWMLFLEDPEVPGRFLLAKELTSRPSSDDIFMIASKFARTQSGVPEDTPPTLLEQVGGTIRSLTSFMRQLSQ